MLVSHHHHQNISVDDLLCKLSLDTAPAAYPYPTYSREHPFVGSSEGRFFAATNVHYSYLSSDLSDFDPRGRLVMPGGFTNLLVLERLFLVSFLREKRFFLPDSGARYLAPGGDVGNHYIVITSQNTRTRHGTLSFDEAVACAINESGKSPFETFVVARMIANIPWH
mmetsp:Transcript_30154/g.48696  ORF Transcript_30154/g.48696 Transcript_30154/m.48696 type:complete len:167 (+) Transcript_30154:212-712(+)